MNNTEVNLDYLKSVAAKHATQEPWHIERYAKSFQWIDHLIPTDGTKIQTLEAGWAGAFTAIMREVRSYGLGLHDTYGYDLRYSTKPLPECYYDLVLCMEVIEHVKDQDRKDNLETFDASGILNMLSELMRVTKPGGHLFLSTPNICHLSSVKRIFEGKHPHQYAPHTRELAPPDVLNYLQQTGWHVDRHELLDVWGGHGVTVREREKILGACYALTNNSGCLHGDCFFVLASKPQF